MQKEDGGVYVLIHDNEENPNKVGTGYISKLDRDSLMRKREEEDWNPDKTEVKIDDL